MVWSFRFRLTFSSLAVKGERDFQVLTSGSTLASSSQLERNPTAVVAPSCVASVVRFDSRRSSRRVHPHRGGNPHLCLDRGVFRLRKVSIASLRGEALRSAGDTSAEARRRLLPPSFLCEEVSVGVGEEGRSFRHPPAPARRVVVSLPKIELPRPWPPPPLLPSPALGRFLGWGIRVIPLAACSAHSYRLTWCHQHYGFGLLLLLQP